MSTAPPKKSTEADDLLDFLNSLPEDDKKKEANTTNNSNGKTDEEILEFLDELEANNKDTKKNLDALPPTAAVPAVAAEMTTGADTHTEIPLSPEQPETTTKETITTTTEPMIDPISSISSWWSNEGSSRVTSIWGSAQLKAEGALKMAKEKGLDQEHIRKAFNDMVIKEQDGEEGEGNHDDELKLPDPGRAIESLNKGFGLFSSRLGSVIEKLNTDLVEFSNGGDHDEVLNIKLIHDLKNYQYYNNLIGSNFKKVMNSQVEGDLLIKVTDNHISDKNDDIYKRNLNIFHGKISDCEKLILANLEESIKAAKPREKETHIFIGLHPVTVQSTISDSTSTDEINIDLYNPGNFSFIIILKDITHDLTIITKSQPFPMKWANWVDGSMEDEEKLKSKEEKTEKKEIKPEEKEAKEEEAEEEEDINVDPSQWVKGWIRDGLDLGFGVLAQSYAIKRMGY